MGFFDKLKKINIFAGFGSELTDDFYDELEESLILADTGMDVTLELVEELRRRVKSEGVKTMEGAREVKVNAALPKFTSDYKAELSEVLAGMGMPLAFDRDLADFSLLGSWENGNLSIDKVIHKTHISVDEQGTEAAASTAPENSPE